MFAENRKRVKDALESSGEKLDNRVLIVNKSFTTPKNDDDCEYFPTKFDPYLTWLTGIFYTDLNVVIHLDTLKMIAFYPKPTPVEQCFIKYYDLQELARFGVTNVIMEDELVQYLKDQKVEKIHFIKGTDNIFILKKIQKKLIGRT